MSKIAGRTRRFKASNIIRPYTKENIIVQLTLAGMLIGGMIIKDHLEARRNAKDNITYMDNYIAGER